jgi:hypothetical protein
LRNATQRTGSDNIFGNVGTSVRDVSKDYNFVGVIFKPFKGSKYRGSSCDAVLESGIADTLDVSFLNENRFIYGS